MDFSRAIEHLDAAAIKLTAAYERPHQPPLVTGAVDNILRTVRCLNCAAELEELSDRLREGLVDLPPSYRDSIREAADLVSKAKFAVEKCFEEFDESFIYWTLESEQRPPGRTW